MKRYVFITISMIGIICANLHAILVAFLVYEAMGLNLSAGIEWGALLVFGAMAVSGIIGSNCYESGISDCACEEVEIDD